MTTKDIVNPTSKTDKQTLHQRDSSELYLKHILEMPELLNMQYTNIVCHFIIQYKQDAFES